ncbi:EAL domain-containing protein [Janthinobacterium sp.]|uniref:EAL domain-containing protein n=1 Tax=Janthinobacterium sp. TaxID=1871054 RepID=UPI00293D66F5|nr:EAL domain-containing protein [Janthinobacterium sp.]
MTSTKHSASAVPAPPANTSELDASSLLAELRRCQIDLESQNAALREARAELGELHRRLGHGAEPLAAERFARATLDAIALPICVSDSGGTILALNQAWRHCYARQGAAAAGGRCEVGGNYVALCQAAGLGALEAQRLAAGVAAGECAAFEMEFACPDGGARRCFQAKISRLEGAGGKLLIVHEELTERRHIEQALRESEARWQFALEGSGSGVWDLDLESGKLLFSPHWGHILGYPEGQIGSSLADWYEHVQPDDLPALQAALREHLEGRAPVFSHEHRVRCRDGGEKWMLAHGLVVSRDDAGRPARVVGTLADISARKQAERRLQLAASVFTHAREGIMITDAAGTIVEVNDTFTHITGYSRDEALGQNPRMLKSGRQSAAFYADMWKDLLDKGHWYGEAWNRRKDGEVYAEMISVSAVRDAAGGTQNYVALFTDITHMKQYLQQLERIAHFDVLTGLPNRVLLADRLQQALAHSERHGQSLAVAYLDLDGFKAVNDRHGHDVGDELLISIAQRMKDALREGDTLARIGGDEFVAILAELDEPQDCEPALARLLEAAAAPVGALRLHVSASIGVTLYPQDGADADLLLRHADQAMYHAKQAGKNRYHLFDVGRDEAARKHRQQIEAIRVGLERQQFVLYYQPKVNMKSGAVIGAEALIRWQHPQNGLLAPGVFLPAIETHPLSVPLGEWVIASALRQISAWRAAGFEMAVSVNVGAHQLQRPDFLARLAALLAAQPDVPPQMLELEILETSALGDMAMVSELMHACRALGVHFALDDFGTGYSSLTYLKRLPVELLKIDQSFVRGMLDDADSLAIIDGVVGLAAAFRRQVIAEGVETVAHGELLLPLGCELAQGYGIARPMPAAELPGWARDWRPDPAWSAWSERPLRRDDVTVVFAEVEHRHWLRGIERFLAGARDAARPSAMLGCHFSRWHSGEGQARFGAAPEFLALVSLHEDMHAQGRALVELHAAGEAAQIGARLERLHASRDELIERLRHLVREGDELRPAPH